MNLKSRLAVAISFLAAILCSPQFGISQDTDSSNIWEQRSRFHDFQSQTGTIPGKLVSETKGDDGRTYVVIETPSGGYLKLDKGRVIKNVRDLQPLFVEYQAKTKTLNANSADEHLSIAQWIKDQSGGVVKLSYEFEYHLQEVVRLDSKMDKAWQLLGYKEYDGVWAKPENMWDTHGYVRTKKGLIPSILSKRLDDQQKFQDFAAEERSNFKKWQKQIGKVDLIQHAQQLVPSPSIIHDLFKSANKATNLSLRMVYVDAIGDISSYQAMTYLLHFAVRDNDRAIRDRALTLLKQEKYNQAAIAQKIANELLVSPNNTDVLRGANVIGELGQTNVILPLIDALNTTHKVANPNGSDPGRLNTTFDGSGGIGFQQNNAPKIIPRTLQNEDVLLTLRRLTNYDDGYDEMAWKTWYSDQFTVLVDDLRGDD